MVSVVFSRVSEKPASELVQRIGLQDVEAESTTPGGNLGAAGLWGSNARPPPRPRASSLRAPAQ